MTISADTYSHWSLEDINSRLTELPDEIDKAEKSWQAMRRAGGNNAGEWVKEQTELRENALNELRRQKAALEAAQKERAALQAAEAERAALQAAEQEQTALTTTQTEEVAVQQASEAGLATRLANAGRGALQLVRTYPVTSALTAFVIAAVLTYLGALALGERSADRPVGFGERGAAIQGMLTTAEGQRDRLRKVDTPDFFEPVGREGYAVWLVGEGKEVMVGRKTVIEEQPSSSVIGWGLDPIPVKRRNPSWQQVGPFYRTAEQARLAYLRHMRQGTIRRLPLARGMVARFDFDGQEHCINNALRFLR